MSIICSFGRPLIVCRESNCREAQIISAASQDGDGEEWGDDWSTEGFNSTISAPSVALYTASGLLELLYHLSS